MRGGDADPAVEPELADGVVDHLRADHPEIADVGAAVGSSLDHRGRHRGRRDAHVAADRDRLRLEVLDVGAADRVRALLVELGAVEAADVVCLEDPGIEHVLILEAPQAAPRRVGPCAYPSVMERKLATVVFIDLVGSTQLVASADPEVVRSRLARFFDQVSHCVTAHGGIVEKYAGDAIMAAFGVQVAHEDDAERAVRAAHATLEAVRELELEVRIGIETGEILADETEATFATGARDQRRGSPPAGRCSPGEVLLGPGVERLTRGVIETTPLGAQTARGFPRRGRSLAPRVGLRGGRAPARRLRAVRRP